MTDYKLISADSHVSEPTDLWVERVDKRYRDRAPRSRRISSGLLSSRFSPSKRI